MWSNSVLRRFGNSGAFEVERERRITSDLMQRFLAAATLTESLRLPPGDGGIDRNSLCIECTPMVDAKLTATCDEALTTIAENLHATAMSFGSTDFPDDGGKSFRNHFLGYPFSVFQTMYIFLDDKRDDKWVVRNETVITQIDSSVFVPLVGQLHFFAEARRLNHAFQNRNSVARAMGSDAGVRVMLDWVTNSYECERESPIRWFELIKEHEDPIHFQHAAQGQLAINLSKILPRPVGTGCDNWPGFAFAADITRSAPDDPEWNEHCNEWFDA